MIHLGGEVIVLFPFPPPNQRFFCLIKETRQQICWCILSKALKSNIMSLSDNEIVPASTQQVTLIMNEHASFCIEIGYYEEAITLLAAAIETITDESEILRTETTTSSCNCMDCTLGGCLSFSRKYSKLTPNQRSKLRCSQQQDRRAKATQTQPQGNDYIVWPSIVTAEGSVYSHPIRAPRASIHEGHSMDRCLVQLILTFNLALALHLQAMLCPQNDFDEYSCEYNLNDARDLYKEVFRLQLNQAHPRGPGHACLKMILANNLGMATNQGSKEESTLRDTLLREKVMCP